MINLQPITNKEVEKWRSLENCHGGGGGGAAAASLTTTIFPTIYINILHFSTSTGCWACVYAAARRSGDEKIKSTLPHLSLYNPTSLARNSGARLLCISVPCFIVAGLQSKPRGSSLYRRLDHAPVAFSNRVALLCAALPRRYGTLRSFSVSPCCIVAKLLGKLDSGALNAFGICTYNIKSVI